MIVYRDYITFKILNQDVNIISDEMEHRYNTVAEINDRFYYVGNEFPSISSAIFAWQEVNERDLTDDELRQIMIENNLISEAT